jgi:hypothetical protein
LEKNEQEPDQSSRKPNSNPDFSDLQKSALNKGIGRTTILSAATNQRGLL